MNPPSAFDSLECIPGLSHFPCGWQRFAGAEYQALKTLCLQPTTPLGLHYPCPHNCGCWHRVVPRDDGAGAVGVCECDPPTCPDLTLSIEDITPLEVNRAKLGRAICRALLLNPKPLDLPSPNTAQIGSWSAGAVPVILTIQSDPFIFRTAIAELVAQLNQPFILLAPTSDYLTAICQSHLARVNAGYFPLLTTLRLTEHGKLVPVKPPGELFAAFTPQPKEIEEDAATRAFALVQQFDSKTLAVFREYCLEGLSASQAASKLKMSKTAVMRRLNSILQKTGTRPAELRRFSSHIAKLEAQVSDPRATRIRRSP